MLLSTQCIARPAPLANVVRCGHTDFVMNEANALTLKLY